MCIAQESEADGVEKSLSLLQTPEFQAIAPIAKFYDFAYADPYI